MIRITYRSFFTFALLFAVACAPADPDAASHEGIGSSREALDVAALWANQVIITQDGTTPARSTGAVFIPVLDGNHAPTFVASSQYGNLPVRGTCGLTFVSPHYAITASHCFSDANAYDPANQTFTAKSFDLGLANASDFNLAAMMQGTFPNYTPVLGRTMDQIAGYRSTTFTCRIASRCPYPGASSYNCDGVSAPDVAMLYCPSRSADSAWLPIASDSSTSGAVYMYWFHELFRANSDPDMIAHYTTYGSLSNNWHYLAAPTNVFLPFRSIPWANGAQRTRVGPARDNDVKTDLYGCHGTSGSGVLSLTASGYALLGPVHNGDLWASFALCDDPNLLTQGAPGGHGLTYNSNVSVNALAILKYASVLQSDRLPPTCGDGTCNGSETQASCPSDCGCGAGTRDCCGDGVCRTPDACRKTICR